MLRTVNSLRYLLCLVALVFGMAAMPAMAEPALEASKPQVNINLASAEELSEVLSGVGPAKAQAIVEYRETHGPFESAQDLGKVKGIGPSTLEKNLPFVKVE